jgi:site-specific DNA-methyltransferase (adenine-specific)
LKTSKSLTKPDAALLEIVAANPQMIKPELPRLDNNEEIRKLLLPHCRLKAGEIWEDPVSGHKVACMDASNEEDTERVVGDNKVVLAVQDPPYNMIIGNANSMTLGKTSLPDYLEWSGKWVRNTINALSDDAHFYVWLGADQNNGFQPLADFMMLMREFEELRARSFITMRNQRGYGTQKNWMAIRQELLCYAKGKPEFNVEAEYTDIPRILKGYYKRVGGKSTETSERSRSDMIRAGNVWVDIQQVFYRMQENVPGCYAQKPLEAIDRIISASSGQGDLIADFFAHSGTTLLSAERLKRRCFTLDVDPIFAEITIRRLDHFRKTGRTGWQTRTPFPEVMPFSP